MIQKEIIIGTKIEKAFIQFDTKRNLFNLLLDLTLISNLQVTKLSDMQIFEKQLHDCYNAYIKNNPNKTYKK